MSEFTQDQPDTARKQTFGDYYHHVHARLHTSVVHARGAAHKEKLDLEKLSTDLVEMKKGDFIDAQPHTAKIITESLQHEIRLLGRLAKAQEEGPLLPRGFMFWVEPPASTKPIGFSPEAVKGLYAVGANEQAIREISVQHLDDALTRGGLSWLAANISGIRAVRRVQKDAVYDATHAHYDEIVTEGKVIRTLTDHELLVAPSDLRTPTTIAMTQVRLLGGQSRSFIQE